MGRKKKSEEVSEFHNNRTFNTAETEEARENQMIELAMDLVEFRLRNGTASSQETTHFLKLGSLKARQDYEIGEKQKSLLEAKTSAINEAKSMDKLYQDAIRAMKEYSPEQSDIFDE